MAPCAVISQDAAMLVFKTVRTAENGSEQPGANTWSSNEGSCILSGLYHAWSKHRPPTFGQDL